MGFFTFFFASQLLRENCRYCGTVLCFAIHHGSKCAVGLQVHTRTGNILHLCSYHFNSCILNLILWLFYHHKLVIFVVVVVDDVLFLPPECNLFCSKGNPNICLPSIRTGQKKPCVAALGLSECPIVVLILPVLAAMPNTPIRIPRTEGEKENVEKIKQLPSCFSFKLQKNPSNCPRKDDRHHVLG